MWEILGKWIYLSFGWKIRFFFVGRILRGYTFVVDGLTSPWWSCKAGSRSVESNKWATWWEKTSQWIFEKAFSWLFLRKSYILNILNDWDTQNDPRICLFWAFVLNLQVMYSSPVSLRAFRRQSTTPILRPSFFFRTEIDGPFKGYLLKKHYIKCCWWKKSCTR